MCLESLFFKEVLATVVALFWQTGKGGEWQVIWCLRRPQKFMILGLCVSRQCRCLSSSWWKERWSRSCRWRRQVAKRDPGKFYQHALLHHQAVLTYTLPPLPLHLLLIIIILLLLLLILLLLVLFEKPPSPPSSPAGTWRIGTGRASSSPRFQNIDRF